MVKDSKGRFVKVQCGRCGNRQIIYGKPATRVKCEKCNKLLVKLTGGKAKLKTLVREVL